MIHLKFLAVWLVITIPLLAQNNQAVSRKKLPIANRNVAASGWKFGIQLYSFHKDAFPEEIEKARAAGFRYVEGFSFGKAGAVLNDTLLKSLSPDGIRKLSAYVKKSGLIMESIYLTGGPTLDNWVREFRLAKQLNVKYVTAEPPVQMWDSIDSLAKAHGILVAIHNHKQGESAYWHPDSVLAALKNHPTFRACPDIGHWARSGINPIDGLKKLEGHILSIHLKDVSESNSPTAKDVPLGKGTLTISAVMDELRRQKYTGYIILEDEVKPSTINSISESVAYYQEQMKRLQN